MQQEELNILAQRIQFEGDLHMLEHYVQHHHNTRPFLDNISMFRFVERIRVGDTFSLSTLPRLICFMYHSGEVVDYMKRKGFVMTSEIHRWRPQTRAGVVAFNAPIFVRVADIQ